MSKLGFIQKYEFERRPYLCLEVFVLGSSSGVPYSVISTSKTSTSLDVRTDGGEPAKTLLI